MPAVYTRFLFCCAPFRYMDTELLMCIVWILLSFWLCFWGRLSGLSCLIESRWCAASLYHCALHTVRNYQGCVPHVAMFVVWSCCLFASVVAYLTYRTLGCIMHAVCLCAVGMSGTCCCVVGLPKICWPLIGVSYKVLLSFFPAQIRACFTALCVPPVRQPWAATHRSGTQHV